MLPCKEPTSSTSILGGQKYPHTGRGAYDGYMRHARFDLKNEPTELNSNN